jgi:hypothetical protein
VEMSPLRTALGLMELTAFTDLMLPARKRGCLQLSCGINLVQLVTGKVRFIVHILYFLLLKIQLSSPCSLEGKNTRVKSVLL